MITVGSLKMELLYNMSETFCATLLLYAKPLDAGKQMGVFFKVMTCSCLVFIKQ